MNQTQKAILRSKITLDLARDTHDPLKIDLAEAAMNDLLDRQNVTGVTRNIRETEKHAHTA